jgi:hypothetical protein
MDPNPRDTPTTELPVTNPDHDREFWEDFPHLAPGTPEDQMVFVCLRTPIDDVRGRKFPSEGPVVLTVLSEDFFSNRHAPVRTQEHFTNRLNDVHCTCLFCRWFRSNLVID